MTETSIQTLLEIAELTSKGVVSEESRSGYASKIKYITNFMRQRYPEYVENDALKLPLSFESISALFAQLQTDTSLSKAAKKKRKEDEQRRDQLILIRDAAIARGDLGVEEEELPEIIEDTTINKANSIAIAKSVLGGYKAALKLLYRDMRYGMLLSQNT